jgi:hypothetical protein
MMPFRLTNAPADFQRFINDILRPFLDVFATAYLDDILIYSESLLEHRHHVKQVLDSLNKAGLYLKTEKCLFYQSHVKYLGLIISDAGVEMDPGKIEAVMKWPVPSKLKEVQGFLGFANFYCRFICDYLKIVKSLTELMHKNTPFVWSTHC